MTTTAHMVRGLQAAEAMMKIHTAVYGLGALALAACASASEGASSSSESEATGEAANLPPFSFAPSAEDARDGAGQPALVPSNAFWLAALSGLSYGTGEQITKALLGAGLDFTAPGQEFRFFDEPSTSAQAFYLSTGKVAFLVFRGSQEKRDWELNGEERPLAGVAPGGAVHTGDQTQLQSVWPTVREFLAQRHYRDDSAGAPATRGVPLYVGGHSLGGALATLATYHALYDGCLRTPGWAKQPRVDPNSACNNSYIPVAGLYTYGQPRAGDLNFARDLAGRMDKTRTAHFRFVNGHDIVAGLPGIPYRHVGARNEFDHIVGLSADGALLPGRVANPFERAPCTGAVEDHSIRVYAEKLLAKANATPYKAPPCNK